MKFGVKATEDKGSSGGTSSFIKYFGEDGETTLRFLEEYDEWISYWEHFSMEKKCSYPCTGDKKTCPGCNCGNEKEAKASRKLLVNALDENGYVNLWKLPGSLKDKVEYYLGKSSRSDDPSTKTLTDREYIIIRATEGQRTSYSMDKEDPAPIDLTQYAEQIRDKQEALQQAFDIAWDAEVRAAHLADMEARKNNKATKVAQRDVEEEDPTSEPEPEVPFELQSKEEKAKAKPKAKLSVVKDPEPEPEIELTPSQIKKMTAEGLTNLYDQVGFSVPEEIAGNRDAMAEKLIELLSE